MRPHFEMVSGARGWQSYGMRIESWINLADCVFIIDGHRIPASNPMQTRRQRVAVGVADSDARFLAEHVGASGIIQTREGVVLMRLKIQRVDPVLNLVEAEPVPL